MRDSALQSLVNYSMFKTSKIVELTPVQYPVLSFRSETVFA